MSRSMYDRLLNRNGAEFAPRHLSNVLNYLIKEKDIPNPNIRDQWGMSRYLHDNFTPYEVDRAHFLFLEEYKANKSGRAFRRGRSPGALNRNNYQSNQDQDQDQDQNLSIDQIAEELGVNEPKSEPVHSNGKAEFDIEALKQIFETIQNANKSREIITGVLGGLGKAIADLNYQIVDIQDNRPTIIELKREELPNIELGVQHRNFPLFVKAATARLRSGNHQNVWLHGPAGTGKTTAAEKLAELLGLDFYYNGALTSAFQLLGYNDANGNYISTAFRKAWEHGGVYLFDEIDGSMPDALLAMNGALANSIASFPDGMIKRHKDCIIIAGANTTGMGGGIEYVGAMKQNAAFLNRFVYVSWPHDNALEDALCANKDWVQRVRVVRERWQKQGNKGHLITMRATIFGESLLAAGLSQQEVEEATLKQGLSDAQWDAIKH